MTTTTSTSAMISSSLLALLATSGISRSTSIFFARADLVPGARSLSIDELAKLVATETDTEFDWSGDEDEEEIAASRLWQDAVSFEWNKAEEAEYIDIQKYPYLLCHIGKDPSDSDGKKNLSGHQRKEALKASIDFTDDISTYHFRPLYNEEDYLCVYGQLYASEAAGITGEDFIVQPIIPSLKYMKGSVDGMRKEIEFHNLKGEGWEFNPSLDIVLCPGVATAAATADVESSDIDGEEMNDVVSDAAQEAIDNMVDGLSAPDNVNVGEYGQGWEELPTDTSQEIIQMLVPSTIASKLANTISDTYYLTSDSYTNTTADMGTEPTERSKLWKGLIRDYQESRKCDETYAKNLKWSISRAEDAESDVSTLNVEFNTTGNSEFDTGCFLTLSMAIAGHPNVCSLEARERVDTANTVITWLTQSELENKRPFFDAGLDGTGQVVALSDTGVDRDNCYFENGDMFVPGRKLQTGARKLAQYVPFVDETDQQYGHGTHVAGTIAGKRIDAPGMADGIAPGAKIAFADIGNANGDLSLPLDSMLLATGRPAAKIHSASWGGSQTFYTTQARSFDQYMYDNDDFLIVIAAGNSGHGDAPQTVGSPATGKNVIAVGAHHNTASSTPKHGLGPSYIADFSSRGPTSDGRMKPDLMAPGKAVLSAGALPNSEGECDPKKNPGANGKSDGVLSLQGTSMATPVVSGTAAIIRQYFEQGYYPTGVKDERNILVPNPSGGLIKAVLMNGAQWLQGVDNGPGDTTEIKQYDNNQGFGRLSLQDSVYLPGKTEVEMTAFDREFVQDQGLRTFNVKIDKSGGCAYDRLAVTLVWVEQGSQPGCTRCVLNDLDLTVNMNGQTYYPNGLGRADRENSAERIIIEGVNDGDEAIITVEGFNLINAQQKFSLVATGCFGGVANQNFLNECSAFDCDDSDSKRTQTILMAVFIPLGVILLCCVGMAIYKRRQR